MFRRGEFVISSDFNDKFYLIIIKSWTAKISLRAGYAICP